MEFERTKVKVSIYSNMTRYYSMLPIYYITLSAIQTNFHSRMKHKLHKASVKATVHSTLFALQVIIS